MPAAIVPLTRTIKVDGRLSRAATIERDEKGVVQFISIASNQPYRRFDYEKWEYYWEVLGHAKGDIDEERLKSGLPVCFNHDTDRQLATARGWFIKDGKLCLKYDEFIWTAGEFTLNKKADMESGALPHTSVSYELSGDGRCIGAKDDLPIYEFPWKPYEGGPVVIPADASVGVGRSRNREDGVPSGAREIIIVDIDKANISGNKHKTNPPMKLSQLARQHFEADKEKGGAGDEIDVKAEQKKALDEYKARCKKIDDFTKGLDIPAWKKKAEELAAKHKDGDADFLAFHTELMPFLKTPGAIDEPNERGGGIEVIGERRAPGQRALSIGTQFMQSKEVKACNGRLPRGGVAGIDIPNFSMIGIRGKVALAQRAGFTSSDLSAVNITVASGIVALGVQRLTIMDVIATGTIGTGAYKYARENGFGTINGVAVAAGAMPRAQAVGERGLKPTWEPDLSTETATVSKIAITTKVPDEFLSDFPSAMSYIDDRLPFMVDTETEFQILYGDGLNNNLKGILTTAGIQTRAIVTTDDSTKAASLRQGLTDIQVGAQFEPDFFGFHPYDWETASLLKDTAGRFLAGGPFYVPYTNGVFMELHTFWGKPVVVSTAITYGQPITGCGKLGAQALIREGMRIETTNANEDDFRRNLICLRAEHRLALPVYRPVAFLEFTGWPARA